MNRITLTIIPHHARVPCESAVLVFISSFVQAREVNEEISKLSNSNQSPTKNSNT